MANSVLRGNGMNIKLKLLYTDLTLPLINCVYRTMCLVPHNIKQPHYKPWQAPRFPGGSGSQISRQLAQSAISTGRLYHPENIPGNHFYYRLSQPQGYSAAGRFMSMKHFYEIIGNRTRDLPVCIAVPQPTAPLRALSKNRKKLLRFRLEVLLVKFLWS
jgi:hypothetical protein